MFLKTRWWQNGKECLKAQVIPFVLQDAVYFIYKVYASNSINYCMVDKHLKNRLRILESFRKKKLPSENLLEPYAAKVARTVLRGEREMNLRPTRLYIEKEDIL